MTHLLRGRNLVFIGDNAVPGGILISTAHPVSDPLTSDEDWKSDEELELDHLERRCVAMAHQVPNETAVIADRFGPLSIRDARRLDNRRVVPHVVHKDDVTVSQDRVFHADLPFRLGHDWAGHWGLFVHVAREGLVE